MTALAVQTAAAAPPPSGPTPVAAKSDAQGGFAALLGQLNDPKAADKQAKDDAAASQTAADSSQSSLLQSLEAALASLAALTTPAAAAPTAAAKTETTSSSLDAALSAAAGALEATGWDSTGKTPLKALLESDPSLGLTDFQIKTFLAAAGATPARVGATPLGADSAWSPLEAAKAALANASPATGDISTLSGAALSSAKLARAGALDLKSHGLGGHHGAAAIDLHGAASEPNLIAAASGAGAASHRGEGDPADSGGAAPAAAVQAAAADASSVPSLIVPFADLPQFIADQAATLTTAASDPAPGAPAATAQSPKAAQAVKELHIALDPADLGEMTLKLRLTGGKLSVTISVANPQTLSAIEDDRNLIASRLASGDQSLEALNIQRQNPSAAQQETGASNGFANNNGSQSGSPDKGASSQDSERPKPASRGGSGAGGAFSEFVV